MSGICPQFVDDELFESQLSQIRAAQGDPNLGVYGPDSLTWKIDREAVLFMGAGRATLLQTAHPWVAAAIDQLSTTKQDPIGRFHRTFTMMYAMVFGTMDQALGKARALHRIHKQVTGTIKEDVGPFKAGSQFYAGDVDAMLWVFATLLDTSSRMYELVFPPLSNDDKSRLYDEQRQFAHLFGLPDQALPPTWKAFVEYNKDMWHSEILSIGREGHELCAFVMHGELGEGKRTVVSMPQWFRAVTAGFLPEPIRTRYELPFGAEEQKAAARALHWAQRVYPRLPNRLRYVAPYQEAMGRLEGRTSPDLITRGLNRVWVGQPTLVS